MRRVPEMPLTWWKSSFEFVANACVGERGVGDDDHVVHGRVARVVDALHEPAVGDAGRDHLEHGAVHVAEAVGAEIALDRERADAAVVRGEHEEPGILAGEVAPARPEEAAVHDHAVGVVEHAELGGEEIPTVVHVVSAVVMLLPVTPSTKS